MNKDFIIGFLTGLTIALILSSSICYYYVVQEIRSVKTEAKENITTLKHFWQEELQDRAAQVAKEKKDGIIDYFLSKTETPSDSTQVD